VQGSLLIGYLTFFVQLTFHPHRLALREKGVQYFLRGAERETIYPMDMWHGGTNYARISRMGVLKRGDVGITVTPAEVKHSFRKDSLLPANYVFFSPG